jgi:hypothetical protein
MSEQDDETSTPLMDEAEFNRALQPEVWRTIDFLEQPLLAQRLAAEMNRRLSRAQTKLIRAQNVRLEAQDQLNNAQLGVARSLRNATWVLSLATIFLVVATLLQVHLR